MGLAERRKIATYKQEHGPRFQKELDEAAGFSLPLEIDFSSLPENETVLGCYDYYYESYGPGLVPTVFKHICQDDLGRDAVREKIDKVLFRNTARSPEEPGDKDVRLEGRTLVIESSFYGYSDKLFGEDDLRAKIEAML
ncbi:MAG: hypothetical protein AB7N76_04720 [Planctomycetota bacterium]